MANAFKVKTKIGLGTADSAVYTCPGATQTTIIGMNLANIKSTSIQANVRLHNVDGEIAYIIKDAPIPTGSALVPVGGDQKLVMEAGDIIKVSSDTDSSIDATLSILEIT